MTPPQRLPLQPEGIAVYLAEALGHPVYERWTWKRLIEGYGALPDARRAKPTVCRLLIDVPAVIEAWQRGRLLVTAEAQSPEVAQVVIALLKTHGRRFKASVTPVTDVTVVATAVDGLPVSLIGWLQRVGRFRNPHADTNTLGARDDHVAVAAFLRERDALAAHLARVHRRVAAAGAVVPSLRPGSAVRSDPAGSVDVPSLSAGSAIGVITVRREWCRLRGVVRALAVEGLGGDRELVPVLARHRVLVGQPRGRPRDRSGNWDQHQVAQTFRHGSSPFQASGRKVPAATALSSASQPASIALAVQGAVDGRHTGVFEEERHHVVARRQNLTPTSRLPRRELSSLDSPGPER